MACNMCICTYHTNLIKPCDFLTVLFLAEKGKFSERQYKLIKRYILLSQNSYRFAENYLSDARLVVVLRKHTP